MWSNNQPPPASSGDHFNNNSAVTNPYSRSASAPKVKPGRKSTDPWDWGWEDNSAQHDDWNSGWNNKQGPVPNVIPNPSPSLYASTKVDKKAQGTPDLIPERVNAEIRGNTMDMGHHQHYNQHSNSDFFENIDLVSYGNQSNPPNLYNMPDGRRTSQQSSAPQNFPMYQPQVPHSTANIQNVTPASYFNQPPSGFISNQQFPYYQPPPAQHRNAFQNSQYYAPGEQITPNQLPNNSSQLPNNSSQLSNNSYYNQSLPLQDHTYSYGPNQAFGNKGEVQFGTHNNTVEVENVEVPLNTETAAPPVSLKDLSRTIPTQQSLENSQGTSLSTADESSIPDNQENVPENEERVQNLQQTLSKMKISSHNSETWNNPIICENQEVAPRCELDRNQYLETGQLVDSSRVEEVATDVDNNDEVEALPPPGLHRMVTGQGTESISQRSVIGQLPNASQQNGSGYARLMPGPTSPRASPEPAGLERLVPGQQNNEVTSSSRTSLGHRVTPHQEQLGDVLRNTEHESPVGVRMVPGQLSDDESNLPESDTERMIPGGASEHESSFLGGVPDDERMVPGGMSDDSRSQSISIDDEARNSSERMVPGMTETNNSQTNSQNERLVTGAGSVENLDPSNRTQDGSPVGHRSGTAETLNPPPPGLHRLVLGQINTGANADSENGTAERAEETHGGNPPPGMQRMVVGQFREKEVDSGGNDKDKEAVKCNDRENDSDSDERSYRRRQRHRRDSYDEDRRERDRDYSSEREYRGKREERREYRKKRDNSYNRSPEYRSDNDDYDRSDYRDRRERDKERRDRPRDRERRRRSPEYNYDPYYRDDPRKLHPRDRDRRYYDTYEDDYYYRENRSRPSSRSGSDYRRQRDYPPRQPYYPDQGGMGNYMHYYQMQQYYENMRRNDPQAYALWYERYMAEKFGAASNDRASVHSGRSSANDNSHLQENDEEDGDGVKAEDAASHRSTPPLYPSAHIRGQFNVLGQLLVVNPHDPFSYGEHHATVTLCRVAGPNAADSADVLEFLQNPGPFVSGVTHKNTVLQYLKKQADHLSHSSGKLLYELIRLVIKLNGVVDMTDVADLLMASYRNNKADSKDFSETTFTVEEAQPLSPSEVTSKFRELLLEGNKTEALEWAMKNKDWGHALFLASKMDSRTHNNVMLRFANGLQNNDPLQTLYQLMSGREPQAATCAADKKWGDWRPHLAMMLSNRTANLELDRKAILTLGDSLGSRGRLYASHFCYLTAQLEFSNYSDPHAKLVLLGASANKPFHQFATCHAIMLTLCYEYAKQLSNREWCIVTLRPYKFLLACRLYDHGNLPAALAYLEALAEEVMQTPHREDRPLVQLVVNMADKIKSADANLAFTSDPSSDPEWLARLKLHAQEASDPNYLPPRLGHGVSTSTVSDLEPISTGESVFQGGIQDLSLAYQTDMTAYPNSLPSNGYSQEGYYNQMQNNYHNPQENVQAEVEQMTGYNVEQNTVTDNSMSFWPNHASSPWDHQQQQQQQQLQQQQQQQQVDTFNQQQPEESAPTDQQPQISVKPGFGYFASSEEDTIKPQVESKSPPPAPADKADNREKSNRRTNKTQQSGPGWFGGIWDKLALRPKNQMKLPDDRNPAIVWDEKAKRWVNTDASEEEQNAQLKPPPKASEVSSAAVSSSAAPVMAPNPTGLSSLPPLPTSASNTGYKLQRGKGMRSNYVDIMGSNKKSVPSTTNQPQAFPAVPQAPVTNFFIPSPVAGNDDAPIDFVSPSGPVSYEPSSSKADDQLPPLGADGKSQ